MTIYSAYESDSDGVACLPERFNWFAALLPLIWALVHRLWRGFALLLVIEIGIAVLAGLLGVPFLGLYLLFAIWVGFEANQMHGRGLVRRGWRFAGAVNADDRVSAEMAAMRGEIAR